MRSGGVPGRGTRGGKEEAVVKWGNSKHRIVEGKILIWYTVTDIYRIGCIGQEQRRLRLQRLCNLPKPVKVVQRRPRRQ